MGVFGEIGALDTWFLENTEATLPEIVQGSLPAENVNEGEANKWATHSALNRQNPIVQFLSGDTDTVSFNAKLRARDATDQRPKLHLAKLKEWRKIDSKSKRPPVLSFWVGDQHLSVGSCFISSLTSSYTKPTKFGQLREVNVSISLIRYTPYSVEAKQFGETRYHRARVRDYYEMLCYHEYGDATRGDVIRKRHPTQLTLPLAAVVKLPAIQVIRKEVVEPKSIILETAYGKRDTPQRQARLDIFDRRNRDYVSHIVR